MFSTNFSSVQKEKIIKMTRVIRIQEQGPVFNLQKNDEVDIEQSLGEFTPISDTIVNDHNLSPLTVEGDRRNNKATSFLSKRHSKVYDRPNLDEWLDDDDKVPSVVKFRIRWNKETEQDEKVIKKIRNHSSRHSELNLKKCCSDPMHKRSRSTPKSVKSNHLYDDAMIKQQRHRERREVFNRLERSKTPTRRISATEAAAIGAAMYDKGMKQKKALEQRQAEAAGNAEPSLSSCSDQLKVIRKNIRECGNKSKSIERTISTIRATAMYDRGMKQINALEQRRAEAADKHKPALLVYNNSLKKGKMDPSKTRERALGDKRIYDNHSEKSLAVTLQQPRQQYVSPCRKKIIPLRGENYTPPSSRKFELKTSKSAEQSYPSCINKNSPSMTSKKLALNRKMNEGTVSIRLYEGSKHMTNSKNN